MDHIRIFLVIFSFPGTSSFLDGPRKNFLGGCSVSFWKERDGKFWHSFNDPRKHMGEFDLVSSCCPLISGEVWVKEEAMKI